MDLLGILWSKAFQKLEKILKKLLAESEERYLVDFSCLTKSNFWCSWWKSLQEKQKLKLSVFEAFLSSRALRKVDPYETEREPSLVDKIRGSEKSILPKLQNIFQCWKKRCFKFCKLMFILKGKGCHIFSHNLQFNVCTDYFENTFRLNEQPQIVKWNYA